MQRPHPCRFRDCNVPTSSKWGSPPSTPVIGVVPQLHAVYTRPGMEEGTTFGRRLRELRRAKNLSQRDLATAAGVDFTYLSKLENDRMAPPSAETITSLARLLDADLDELSVLAGKLPADVTGILSKNYYALKAFRSIAGDVRSNADWQRFIQERDRPS